MTETGEHDTEARRAWMVALTERSELPMLALAAFTVALYMADLQGVWDAYGLEQAYLTVAFVIDLIFVGDLVVKAVVLRGRYLRTAWFVVDLL